VAILRGPDHVFDFNNESYLRLVGRQDIVGRPLIDALPEIREQGFVRCSTRWSVRASRSSAAKSRP
jgi:hypothetical protein